MEKIEVKQAIRQVLYAGTLYDVIEEKERVLHLRGVKDPKLIVHCAIDSVLLKEVQSENS